MIQDRNVANFGTGRFAAIMGDAHEFLVVGILLRLGLDVGKIDVSSGPYDMFVYGFKTFDYENDSVTEKNHDDRVFIRAQIKTVNGTLSMGGGSRGGKDRSYKSDVKTYRYTPEHNDVVIAVDKNSLDFYVLPTAVAFSSFKKSISTNKLKFFKNNYNILFNWETDWQEAYDQSLLS